MTRNDIKAGDLMFAWGSDFISSEISEFTENGASHVALCLNPITLYEAQGGRVIGENKLDTYLSDPTVTRVEIWRDETLTDDERKKMIEHAKSLFGLPYDYLLIPLELAHFELQAKIDWYHENKRFICSTYVNHCAEAIGKQWSDQENPVPASLYRGKKLSRIITLKGEPQPQEWIDDIAV